MALAWLLARGDDIVPIPGTRSPQRLAENVAAAHVTLTPQDLARVQEIRPHGASGSGYPEAPGTTQPCRSGSARSTTARPLSNVPVRATEPFSRSARYSRCLPSTRRTAYAVFEPERVEV